MNQIQAYYIPSHIKQNAFEYFLQFVSKDRKEKIYRYKSIKDAYRSLIGDIGVRLLICKKFEINNKQIVYHYNKFGKPSVKLGVPFFFNISHSGDWVVIINNSSKVGIDIERIQSIDIDIAKNYFTRLEYEHLLSKEEKKEQIRCFFDLWTLKESYIKFIGKGLSIPLHSFSIIKKSNRYNILHSQDELNYSEEVFFQQYNLGKSYSFSVCSSDQIFPKDIEVFYIEDLLTMSSILKIK